MLLIHGIPATTHRSWSHSVTEVERKSTKPPKSDSEDNLQGADSWVGAEQETVQTPKSECSTPASASSVDQEFEPCATLHYSTPDADTSVTATTWANDTLELDTTIFPFHAAYLLPSEPNGGWRNQASYAMTSSSESAPTLRELVIDHGPKLNFPTLYAKLKEVAQDRKDDLESWTSQKLAGTDLVEIHDRIRRTVTIPSMPKMPQLDQALDAMAQIAQLLRKGRSESEALDELQNDKYLFAAVLCRKAQCALIEQGICKKWQLQCDRHMQLQHEVQAALLHTFTRIQKAYIDVPLLRAQPQWIAERGKKVWRLELDVGKVGVEVGPATDRSLIELGAIDTGFELPESDGCAPIMEIDREVQIVDEEWQLLEA